jgi:hypothetical protein
MDVTTMTRHALERIARGAAMPGAIAVQQRLSIGSVVDDLVLLASCSFPEDWPIRSSPCRFDSGLTLPCDRRLESVLRGGDSFDVPRGFRGDSRRAGSVRVAAVQQ